MGEGELDRFLNPFPPFPLRLFFLALASMALHRLADHPNLLFRWTKPAYSAALEHKGRQAAVRMGTQRKQASQKSQDALGLFSISSSSLRRAALVGRSGRGGEADGDDSRVVRGACGDDLQGPLGDLRSRAGLPLMLSGGLAR